MSDLDTTPRGLPEPLPAGERLLWQGAPTVSGAFLRIVHAPLVVAWFALSAVALSVLSGDGSYAAALGAIVPAVVICALALGLLYLFAWLVHRTTVYTITDKRIAMRVGIALPIHLNLPYTMVDGAGFHGFADGSGDVPVQLRKGERVAYLHLWPHARPWRVSRPEPMLRSIPDAVEVASLLAKALAAHAGRSEVEVPRIVGQAKPAEQQAGLVPAGAR